MIKKIFIIILFVLIFTSGKTSAYKNSIGMTLKVIPPGTFLMGSPKDEIGHEKDEKLHTVHITKPFLMAETETTQKQWKLVMGSNPSSSTNRCDNCPVEGVSWNQVNIFIKKLNLREKTSSYRLPTEAEWEYACRAGSSEAFSSGKINVSGCSFDKNLDKAGWYCGNSGKQKPYYNLKYQRVALKMPNKFGLYDMHGNVMEWCLDSTKWDRLFSRSVSASLETYVDGITNPIGKKGDKKIFRGGSFVHSTAMARAANRFFIGPKAKRNYIGFRVVKEIN